MSAIRQHIISDWIDADGRPIGEQASPVAYAACRDEVTCPYPDRRRGLPMSRGGLRQIRAAWPEILAAIQHLSVPDATTHQAWRVTVAVTIAPLLLPRPTPSARSAAYKACIGFNQILAFLLLGAEGLADTPLRDLASPEELCEWLDREGWLVGHAQVCAGPMRMIAELFSALCGEGAQPDAPGWAEIPGLSAATEQAMVWQAEALAELIGDRCGPLSDSVAPWLVVAGLRAGQRPADVRRLFPADYSGITIT